MTSSCTSVAGVQQLNRGGERHQRIEVVVAEPAGEQRKRGPDALAAGVEDVVEDRGEEREVRLGLTAKAAICLDERKCRRCERDRRAGSDGWSCTFAFAPPAPRRALDPSGRGSRTDGGRSAEQPPPASESSLYHRGARHRLRASTT